MSQHEVDAYISNSSENTQPIIAHLRDLIVKACPEIEQNIKWNSPSFEVNNKIICSVMGFKQHVNFILKEGKNIEDKYNILENIGDKSTMTGIKKITKLTDLPNDNVIIDYVKEAVKFSSVS